MISSRDIFVIWWYTYPPRSLNCSILVKSVRAKRAVQKKVLEKRRPPRNLIVNLVVQRRKLFCVIAYRAGNLFALLAFLRSAQPSIAQECGCELKAAPRGTLGGLTMFHWVCEEREQWQACTNGLAEVGFVFCTDVGMPGRAFGIEGSWKIHFFVKLEKLEKRYKKNRNTVLKKIRKK